VGDFSIGFGRATFAAGNQATAIGALASTAGNNATAVGAQSAANAANATALGGQAVAGFAGSTAVGTLATTTRANQLVLGGTGSSVTIGDIGASDAAQAGPEFILTVDANGTIGRQAGGQSGGQTGQSLLALQNADAIEDLQTGQATIDDMVAAQGRQIAALGRGLEQANGGIAAAMAMGGMMVVPDSKVSVNFNLSTYRGQQGFSGGLAARVSPKVYISGGVAGSTVKGSTGGRVGVAFGF
jgi:trimeric autotransporter adhesin